MYKEEYSTDYSTIQEKVKTARQKGKNRPAGALPGRP